MRMLSAGHHSRWGHVEARGGIARSAGDGVSASVMTKAHAPARIRRRKGCLGRNAVESPCCGVIFSPEGPSRTEFHREPASRRHFLAGGPLSYGIPSGPLAPASFRRRRGFFAADVEENGPPASFRRQSALLGSRREDTRTGTGPMPAPVAGTRWDRSKKDASPDDASPQRRDKGTVPLSHSGKGACSTAGRVRSSREGGTSRPAWSADRHHISSCVRPRSCRSS